MKLLYRLCFLVSAVFLFFSRCTTSPTAGTETGNGQGVTCRLMYPDSTPAAGVKVYLLPSDFHADTAPALTKSARLMAIQDSTSTDDCGRFLIEILDTGTYVIVASDDSSNAVRINNIHIAYLNMFIDLNIHIMKPTGSIAGVVTLDDGSDPRKVFVLALGINRFAIPDSNGLFVLDHLAEGAYDLSILSTADDFSVASLTDVNVQSAQVTNVDTIRLYGHGTPSPKNFRLDYSTKTQYVTLSWDPPDTQLITGYVLYRAEPDSQFSKLSNALIAKNDTMYIDSTGEQSRHYEYRIASKSLNGQYESIWIDYPDDTVTITPCARMLFTVRSSTGAPQDVVALNNGLFAVLSWPPQVDVFDSTGALLHTWDYPGLNRRWGLRIATDESGDLIYAYTPESDSNGFVYRCQTTGNIVDSFPVRLREAWTDAEHDFKVIGNTFIFPEGSVESLIKLVRLNLTDGSQDTLLITGRKDERFFFNPLDRFYYFLNGNSRIPVDVLDSTGMYMSSLSIQSPYHEEGGLRFIDPVGRYYFHDDNSTTFTQDVRVCIYAPEGEFFAMFKVTDDVDLSCMDIRSGRLFVKRTEQEAEPNVDEISEIDVMKLDF